MALAAFLNALWCFAAAFGRALSKEVDGVDCWVACAVMFAVLCGWWFERGSEIFVFGREAWLVLFCLIV